MRTYEHRWTGLDVRRVLAAEQRPPLPARLKARLRAALKRKAQRSSTPWERLRGY